MGEASFIARRTTKPPWCNTKRNTLMSSALKRMQTWVMVPLPLYVSKLRSVQHHGIQLYGVEAVDYSFDVFLAYADLTEGLMDAHGSP